MKHNHASASRSGTRRHNRYVPMGLLLLAGLLAGCEPQEVTQQDPLVPVKAIKVVPQDVELLDQFTGEVSSAQQIELRARVSGVLEQKHFADGAMVEAGQLLFSLDDRDYRARLQKARAELSSARSDYNRARLDVERYRPLLKTQAIARRVYDNATAAMNAAASQVENAEAAVRQAELSVEYAAIRSPVSGRIGAADVDVGDLVNASSTLLASVSTVDSSWIYFSVSESKLLQYERVHGRIDMETGEQTSVQLILADGSLYPYPGRINFADRALNASTGTFRLRAEFPNPDGLLRPGMFARVRVVTEVAKDVIAIPDRALSQLLNDYFVTLVEEGDVARQVSVKPGPRQDGLWIIEQGIEAGDRVVIEGIQKARDGMRLKVEHL
ncbi:MexE family multidrug efflux RND transporter periplasmic adaptor subunit [Marinobacterium nitratireducens]|uniref:MexE family multidrug efflux RND transporter periplasmic adaptor subunit n=1 Tax=Marinobacterium nitratireducens TaxID=518897 RepID=A0A917Z6I0_9GAMM|nr:efflux RND transporter periplasmic adaptor subunit [Marinobacterium nitratireducens]GGO76637.1 MexE family multidrug efflux RND transporter periplasmic adaptor subunit [Marinobacterium nitratireducens]